MKIYLVHSDEYHDIMIEEGANLMLTFASVEKDTFSVKIPEGHPGVLIDSGGFQFQTGIKTAREVTISAYCAWLHYALEKYPEIDGYMALDIMGDTKKTLWNLKYMEDELLRPLPVWHPGEGEELLKFYCNNYEYVAVGGIAGKRKMPAKVLRPIGERILKVYGTNTRFHFLGIGVAATTMFRAFRPYSIDFSTWLNFGRYGSIIKRVDTGIRELDMEPHEKQMIRVNREYRKELARRVIKTIKWFESYITNLNEPYQVQFSNTIGGDIRIL